MILLLESSDSETSEMSGNDEPLQIDEIATSSSSSHNSSSEDKRINVLTRNEEYSLEIIEKITDPQIRKELLEKLLQRPIEPKPEQKPSILPSTKTTYDLTTILKKHKPNQKSVPTIQDLHKEIKEIKEELKILKEQQKIDSEALNVLLVREVEEKNTEQKQLSSLNNTPDQDEDFLYELRQVTYRKYLIKVKVVFSDDFILDTIALFDTGADLNCIKEEIIPKRFHQHTKERLTAANNSSLNVVSKVDASINNKTFQIKTSFLLVKGIHHLVILGTPFFNLITPYTVTYEGITFKTNNTKLTFPFLEKPKTRNLNTIKAYSIYNNKINALI